MKCRLSEADHAAWAALLRKKYGIPAPTDEEEDEE